MNWGKAKIIRLAIMIASLLLVASCGDKLTEAKNKAENAINSIAGKNQTDLEKHNGYVDFYNDAVLDISEHIDRYIENLGKDQELKKGGEYTLTSKYSFWENAKKLPTAKPSMKELDDAAAELIPVAENLDGLLASAGEYYKAKDYNDDKYAKGQELHKKILTEIPKFEAASKKFYAVLNKVDTAQKVEEMNKAKKEGDELTYNKIQVSLLMAKIIDEFIQNDISAINVLSTDLTKIKPLYQEFSEAQKTLRDTANNDKYKEQAKSLGDYIEKTTEFKTAMIELIDRIEAKKALDKSDMQFAAQREGTPEKLREIHNKAIDAFNRNP